jgi:catechol 2,3-dioxygenase-like lactoylglutathione lyase family enzyme
MKIKNIDHMTIIIKDLPKTLHFYGTVMGFTRLPDIDLGDPILHYFLLPGGQKLELNEYLYPTRNSVSQLKDRGTWRHLAFAVDDALSWEKKLISS